jgi:hypothetical protein
MPSFRKYDASAEIAQLTSKLEEMQREQARRIPAAPRGFLGALVATSQLDGRFQVADAAVIASAVIVAGFCFTIAAGAAGIRTGDLEIFKTTATVGWVAASLSGAIALLFELLGLTWPWLRDPSQTDTAQPQVIVHEILVEVKRARGVDRVNVEAAEYERVVLWARECTRLRTTVPHPTAEKYWIGSGKLWSNGKAGRAAFSKLRADLERTGLWTKGAAGHEFTPEGWEFIEQTAALPRR